MTSRADERRGIALVVTLWVMVILVVLLLGFSAVVRTEVTLAGNFANDEAALALARAGVKRALLQLEKLDVPYVSDTDDWTLITSEDDQLEFSTGRYEVQIRDESGKLDLNLATEDMLTQLLGDPALVDPILDWRDADSDPREQGAEDDYYQSLDPPYYCKNGPFETLSELLLVRGITRELFYGPGYASGQPTALESLVDDQTGRSTSVRSSIPGSGGQTGEDSEGLVDFLTVYSFDANTDSEGRQRINLRTASEEDLKARLSDVLSDQEIQAIIGYRGTQTTSGGTSPGNPGSTAGASSSGGAPGGLSLPGGASTGSRSRQTRPGGSAPFSTGSSPVPASSGPTSPGPGSAQSGGSDTTSTKFQKLGEIIRVPGLSREKVAQILDRITNTDDVTLRGRINLNTAPYEVLMTLPLMTEEAAQDIISYRESSGPFTQLGDVLSVDSITDAMFEELADHVTVRSAAFRITADGIITGTTVRRRIEAIVLVEPQATGGQTGATGGSQPAGAAGGSSFPTPSGGSARSRQAPSLPTGGSFTSQAGSAGTQPTTGEQNASGETQPPARTIRIVYWKQ